MDVKGIWTDSDFGQMGWHDSRFYSLEFPGVNNEISLDLDYIFEWVKQENGEFLFWVSLCILKSFESTGFTQNLKKPPVLWESQDLGR